MLVFHSQKSVQVERVSEESAEITTKICNRINIHDICRFAWFYDIFPDEVIKRKALISCLLRVSWDSIYGQCQVSVHREGVNPSSMEGVLDLSDHISVDSGLQMVYLHKIYHK